MNHRSLIGFFAIVIGLLALLQNLQLIQVTQEFLLSILFIIIGIVAFVFSRVTRKNSSALILSLLSMFWGVGLLLNELEIIQRDYKNIIFIIGAGFSFGAIYLRIQPCCARDRLLSTRVRRRAILMTGSVCGSAVRSTPRAPTFQVVATGPNFRQLGALDSWFSYPDLARRRGRPAVIA